MAVADSYNVHNWNILYVAGDLGVPLRTHKTERTASVFEDWVKQNTQPSWKFNIVAGVSQPCSSQRCGVAPVV
jgi:hypothetical protein